MKTRLWLLLLGVLLVVDSRLRADDLNAPNPSVDREAWQTAKEVVQARFAKCPGGVFSRGPAVGPESAGDATCYWQYRQFHWSLNGDRLTYIDVVHGIEWRGTLVIEAAGYRMRCGDDWSPWHPLATIDTYLQKKNGLWNVCQGVADCDLPAGSTAPSCAEVERLLSR